MLHRTQTLRLIVALLVGLSTLLLSGPTVAHDGPALDPTSVEALVFPGESHIVNKTVHTPEFPPLPDIVFLADTTGSMQDAIDNVQANATAIMTQIAAVQPLAQFGAAEYRDFDCSDPFAYRLNQALTPDIPTAQAGINQWSAGDGCDTPEAQINALYQLATDPAVGFRPDPATRIIVWFGDASGHDPSGGVSEAQATAALVDAGILVFAINVDSGLADGLNASGQAQRIADATGGAYLGTASPDTVADQILAGLSNLPVTVSMQSTCVAPISTVFAPASVDIISGEDAAFTETISVAADAAAGDYLCRDVALLNGEVMTDEAGQVISETKLIHVPGIELTPATATNELGMPDQTQHTVTAVVSAGTYGPVAGVPVEFEITAGPNAGLTGSGTTDAAGEASFTYTATQGPAGLGTDTIVASFTNADGSVVYGSATATKDWVDTTPPVVTCVPGVNPGGNTTPAAPGKGGNSQNPDGFYQLNATDAVWPAADIELYVVDTGSGTVFGPFAVGTVIKYTEAPGATPSQQAMAGAVAWHITGTGDMAIYAVDGSGNVSTNVACLVPPAPQ